MFFFSFLLDGSNPSYDGNVKFFIVSFLPLQQNARFKDAAIRMCIYLSIYGYIQPTGEQ